jgi:UDP-2,3-diacylglucosamine pyrophosphatase LpxH
MRDMVIQTLSRMMRSSAVIPQDGATAETLRAAAHIDAPQAGGEGEPELKWRTLWLSDIHLGTRDCKAPQLLEFLRHCSADTIYLVGDIIDGWQLKKKGIYWPQSHNDVVQKLLRKARKGTRVVFVPGNHDEFARPYDGLHFGGIEVINQVRHVTADGRTLLIVHGDLFDSVVLYAKWLAHLGDAAYMFTLKLNRWLNHARLKLGLPYWSLSQYLKHKVKAAVNTISSFETLLSDEARRQQCDGVVCGHIHRAELRSEDRQIYANCGDWVESLTALAEDFDGRLKLLHWNAGLQVLAELAPQTATHPALLHPAPTQPVHA